MSAFEVSTNPEMDILVVKARDITIDPDNPVFSFITRFPLQTYLWDLHTIKLAHLKTANMRYFSMDYRLIIRPPPGSINAIVCENYESYRMLKTHERLADLEQRGEAVGIFNDFRKAKTWLRVLAVLGAAEASSEAKGRTTSQFSLST